MCESKHFLRPLLVSKKSCTDFSKTIINLISTYFSEMKVFSSSGILKMANAVPLMTSSFLMKLLTLPCLAIIMMS